MRVAVLSDIHGNLAALEAVVADFKRRGVDGVVNLGDALSGPLLPRETAQYLMATSWTHLAGNHERQVLSPPMPDDDPSDIHARSELGNAERHWITPLPHCRAFTTKSCFATVRRVATTNACWKPSSPADRASPPPLRSTNAWVIFGPPWCSAATPTFRARRAVREDSSW
jgi:hypothetical protein